LTQQVASLAEADWRRAVEPFVGPDARRASFQLVTTLVPLGALMWAIHVVMPHSLVAALLLAVPTSLWLVRTFIIMHDCAHGSFFGSRRVNDAVGFATGVLTMTPFTQWRRDHALHHASSGDLDRRGHGDVPTLTVREYLAKSPRDRLFYRIIRHPVALLLGGPFHLMIGQRLRGAGLHGRSMPISRTADHLAWGLFGSDQGDSRGVRIAVRARRETAAWPRAERRACCRFPDDGVAVPNSGV